MEQTLNSTARPVRYATRQPIFAADGSVIGYKLLFRTDLMDHFFGSEFESSTVTIEVSSLLGLDALTCERLAFIECNHETLVTRELELLPAEKVVAEISSSARIDDVVFQSCLELKNRGYRIAISDFSLNDPRQPIAGLADFILVDLNQTKAAEIQQILEIVQGRECKLIATGVESQAAWDLAKHLGFHLFQGSFFRSPGPMRTRTTLTNRIVYLRLLSAVSKPELDWREIEELIKSDITIYYRLMRFVNSAAHGARTEPQNVLQALMFLGDDEVRRWCRVAGLLDMTRQEPSEAVLSALIRARSLELLGERINHRKADLFLVGLLTLMDTILEVPLPTLLDGLRLDSSIVELLLEHSGPLRSLLDLLIAVEVGTWTNVAQGCAEVGIDEAFAAACYSNAITWAQSLTLKM